MLLKARASFGLPSIGKAGLARPLPPRRRLKGDDAPEPALGAPPVVAEGLSRCSASTDRALLMGETLSPLPTSRGTSLDLRKGKGVGEERVRGRAPSVKAPGATCSLATHTRRRGRLTFAGGRFSCPPWPLRCPRRASGPRRRTETTAAGCSASAASAPRRRCRAAAGIWTRRGCASGAACWRARQRASARLSRRLRETRPRGLGARRRSQVSGGEM